MKISIEMKSLLEAKETQDFLNVARAFIQLVEDGNIDKQEFYFQIHKKLVDLYSAGLSLKSIQLIYSDEKTDFSEIPQEELQVQNKRLVSSLGQDCVYWEIFDPTDVKDKEATQGWLVDDVADIYADLKKELYKIDEIKTEEAIEDGLWQLKFGFTTHWGNHCVNAIRALHYIYYEGKTIM